MLGGRSSLNALAESFRSWVATLRVLQIYELVQGKRILLFTFTLHEGFSEMFLCVARNGFGTTWRWVNNDDRCFTSKLMHFWVLWSLYRTSPEGYLMCNQAAKPSIFFFFIREKVTFCCLKSPLKSTYVCEGLSGNSSVILPHSLLNACDELVGGESGISECCGKQRTLERNAYDLIHNKHKFCKSSRVSRLPRIYTIRHYLTDTGTICFFWRMMI